MFSSKTLIVCLLALSLCLQVAIAGRLSTRIAGANLAVDGQFPYIVYIFYNYTDTANVAQQFRGTGIIYSGVSLITTANSFNNFPVGGGVLRITAGVTDINLPKYIYDYNATMGTFSVVTPGTPPPNDIIVPVEFVKGSSAYDIAIVKLPPGKTFNLADPQDLVKIANFPTSGILPSDPLFVAAFGNQNVGGPTFPVLKYTRLFLTKKSKCNALFSRLGVTRTFNFAQNFCIRSKINATFFEGVCSLDYGGAIIRTADITSIQNGTTTPKAYYEVVGLLSYASDLTCNNLDPAPALGIYLHIYQDNFFTPILGSLATIGNGGDPAKNPDGKNGLFVCGDNKVTGLFEKCDPAAQSSDPCCNLNTCTYRFPGDFCGTKPKNGTAVNRCVTRLICDQFGACGVHNKPDGKRCGKRSHCVAGSCFTVTA
jgi:hypothetical protein